MQQRRDLLNSFGLRFFVRRINGFKSTRSLRNVPQNEQEQLAMRALADAARVTGGRRAATKQAWHRFNALRRVHEPTLYNASVRRARDGNVSKTTAARQRAQRKNVAAVAAVAWLARVAFGLQTENEPFVATKHDPDVLVVCGRVTFGHMKGHRSTSAKSFVRELARQFLVIEISEWGTSKHCNTCHAPLTRTRGWSIRYWRCSSGAACASSSSRPSRSAAELNKDVAAAHSMLQIGLSLLFLQSRPEAFCSPRVKEHAERLQKQKDAASSGDIAMHQAPPLLSSSSSTSHKRTRSQSSASSSAQPSPPSRRMRRGPTPPPPSP